MTLRYALLLSLAFVLPAAAEDRAGCTASMLDGNWFALDSRGPAACKVAISGGKFMGDCTISGSGNQTFTGTIKVNKKCEVSGSMTGNGLTRQIKGVLSADRHYIFGILIAIPKFDLLFMTKP